MAAIYTSIKPILYFRNCGEKDRKLLCDFTKYMSDIWQAIYWPNNFSIKCWLLTYLIRTSGHTDKAQTTLFVHLLMEPFKIRTWKLFKWGGVR